MILVIKMVKHGYQSLKNLLDTFSSNHYPRIFNQLNPVRRKGIYVFPYLGSVDSKYILAFKMVAMYGLEKKTETEELVRNFRKMSGKKQLFVVYNLSHELKIASLAACIAMDKQYSYVYEIGPCLGFSSLHFSHLIKEKGVDSKPINKLTAIEINKEFVEHAKDMKKMTGDYTGEIDYIHGDAIKYLLNSLKEGDIIFSSIAEPSVIDGLLELSYLKPVNMIISYSEKSNEKMIEMRGKSFVDLIDPNIYDIYPFLDQEHNTHLPRETKKIGVLVLIA